MTASATLENYTTLTDVTHLPGPPRTIFWPEITVFAL
jgi:hypothetical protein